MSSPTRPSRSLGPASRPAWAVEWSRRSRGVAHTSSSPAATSSNAPRETQDYVTRVASHQTDRPSSRLSDHLSEGEQNLQALSHAWAQQRALPVNRNDSDTLPNPRANDAVCSVSGWHDDNYSRSYSNCLTSGHTLLGTPRFQPSRVHEELLKKESIRAPVFGGRSKNQQLGSVAESWGTPPTLEIPRGMFELDDDPPSPTEGQDMSPDQVRAERARRAALGIPAEKSGRPSIKDMEKKRIEKLRHQQLRAERARNEVQSEEKPDDSTQTRSHCSFVATARVDELDRAIQGANPLSDDGW